MIEMHFSLNEQTNLTIDLLKWYFWSYIFHCRKFGLWGFRKNFTNSQFQSISIKKWIWFIQVTSALHRMRADRKRQKKAFPSSRRQPWTVNRHPVSQSVVLDSPNNQSVLAKNMCKSVTLWRKGKRAAFSFSQKQPWTVTIILVENRFLEKYFNKLALNIFLLWQMLMFFRTKIVAYSKNLY